MKIESVGCHALMITCADELFTSFSDWDQLHEQIRRLICVLRPDWDSFELQWFHRYAHNVMFISECSPAHMPGLCFLNADAVLACRQSWESLQDAELYWWQNHYYLFCHSSVFPEILYDYAQPCTVSPTQAFLDEHAQKLYPPEK